MLLALVSRLASHIPQNRLRLAGFVMAPLAATLKGRRRGTHPAGAVLLLGEKFGMIIGSNNEDIDFHR
jgi:hypothetical protein